MVTHTAFIPRFRRTLAGIAAVVAVLLGLSLTAAGSAAAGGRPAPKPTVVFVHGAFADASGWADSIADLQRRGYPVLAPPNPLRGVSSDAAYLRSFLSTISGPIVLVGHSYGGAVITDAATGNPNVKALVYIAAYALAAGESVDGANHLGGASGDLRPYIDLRPYPGAPVIDPASGATDQDVYLKLDQFRRIFAADVPAGRAAVMAASQRPATLIALGEPSGPAAWTSIPSWYLVTRDDQAIPPAAQRAMAARAGATTVEIRSSHAVMVSHPEAVTKLVLSASAKSA
ncbi:lipase family alpha/beta hydrolase [Dactylosporangium sp. CS-033363]|uniref:lipase family alpha/beta hydrolase n=1 Tax=Dactylosporangium sp. CS-033363 TaxID=3239935 RepID=UPI003D94444F